MPIIYSLIARGTDVLTEETADGMTGNFPVLTRSLLKKIGKDDDKMSYVHNLYVFHYVVSDTLTYLCMTDKEFPRLNSFQFLEDIRTRFLATYGDRAKTAIAFALNSDFRKVLAAQMDRYNRMPSGGDAKIERVKEEINQVKDVMIKNIDKVLEIGERIELLVEKSDELHQEGFRFNKKATSLKHSMWWKNAKMTCIIAAVVLVIFFIILIAACGGFSFSKCK